MNRIQILPAEKGHPVSSTLYGIFFEDINFSCDGGINANLVKNYSFDGVFYSNEESVAVSDPLRYWEITGGTLTSGMEGALHENSRYASVQTEGGAVLSNLGYNGEKAHQKECAMCIKNGHEYLFELYVRDDGYEGTVTVQIVNAAGEALTEVGTLCLCEAKEWKKKELKVKGIADGYGKLEIRLEGKGTLSLDCVSFMDCDYWNSGDPKYRYGKFRKDLIQALADMKPAFMRFPGGCIVEGQRPENEYNWKDTVGELYERKSNYNLWSEKLEDGGYNQSYQIGFYEYFCLCEDLGMKPLPTLTVGLNCQIRSAQRGEMVCPNIPIDSEEFKTYIIDNYLDLLDFAMADPAENEWAALRAKMGHPDPFVIDRIGIGNENYGDVYFERFDRIEKAIHAKYPDMLCVLCAGLHPYDFDLMGAPGTSTYYELAKKYKNVVVDEHSYHTPAWFEKQSVRFDNYDRDGAGVYFGEYAANLLLAQIDRAIEGKETAEERLAAIAEAMGGGSDQEGMRPMNLSNQLDTALGEAAFLTGIERNSDIVKMASYAPLFNLIDCDQWNHNLINFNPQTLCLTSNYYVQKMFATHLGSRYLPFEGELPEHVYASVTEDECTIYVKLVNTGAEAFELTMELPYECAAASGEVLQDDRADARNDLQFTGEAVYELVPQEKCWEMNGKELKIQVSGQAVYAMNLIKK